MNEFDILEVNKFDNIEMFDELPLIVYKNQPRYISALNSVLKKDPIPNGWTTKSWIVLKNGMPASRLTAIILSNPDNMSNGFFTDFETIDCVESVSKLFSIANEWFHNNGVKVIKGPMTPHMGDQRGVMIQGNEVGPCIGLPYNPTYYDLLLGDILFKKAMDMYSYRISSETVPSLNRVTEFVKKRNPDLDIREFNINDPITELQKVVDIYNHSWKDHWSFVPITLDNLLETYKSFINFFDPSMGIFITKNGKDIGVFLSIPNVLDEATIFEPTKVIASNLRCLLFGILTEYQRKGFDAVLMDTAHIMIKNNNFEEYEIGWVLESNTYWVNQIEKVYKDVILSRRVFRVYAKNLNI